MSKRQQPKPAAKKAGRTKGSKVKPGPRFQTTSPRKKALPPGVKFRPHGHLGKWTPKLGTPTVLCKELTDDLCELIRAGNYFSTAVAVLGIPYATAYSWTKKGRLILRESNSDAYVPGDYEYVYFITQLKLAHAAAEALDVDRLNHCIAMGDSKALLKKMAVRYKGRWREPKEIQKTVEHKGSIQHTHAILTVEDLRQLPIEMRRKLLETLRGKVPDSEIPNLPAGKNGLVELPEKQ